MNTLPLGKLDADFLARLLRGIPTPPEVLVGPGIGCDVAVIDLGQDELLLAKTDPITFATDAIGYYAVAVNSNDIATSGGLPRWFLVTLLLPEGATTPELVESIYGQLQDTCQRLGIALVGGHTEVTHGLDRPLLVGQMLGQVRRDELIHPDGMRPGDVLLLTKGVALEGTSLIAREQREELLQRGYEPAFLDRCANMLYDPGIMVLPEARAICGAIRPHALHDPTEGGLATAVWEMAEASQVGIRLEYEAIPFLPEAQRLCDEYDLDPLGLIASGSLLAAVAPADAEAAVAACTKAAIACTAIGRATELTEGSVLVRDGREQPLPRFDQDEIARLY
ncbi:MAG: AIR synthase family protein [Armatimonadia bacterium]|nr:AIR synthase family protein [bacterium]